MIKSDTQVILWSIRASVSVCVCVWGTWLIGTPTLFHNILRGMMHVISVMISSYKLHTMINTWSVQFKLGLLRSFKMICILYLTKIVYIHEICLIQLTSRSNGPVLRPFLSQGVLIFSWFLDHKLRSMRRKGKNFSSQLFPESGPF